MCPEVRVEVCGRSGGESFGVSLEAWCPGEGNVGTEQGVQDVYVETGRGREEVTERRKRPDLLFLGTRGFPEGGTTPRPLSTEKNRFSRLGQGFSLLSIHFPFPNSSGKKKNKPPNPKRKFVLNISDRQLRKLSFFL